MFLKSKLKLAQKAWMISGLLVLGAVLHGAAFHISPAYAQSTRDLVNRIGRLENEIETLSRTVYRGEAPPPGALSGGGDPSRAADAQVRIQQLEIELRDMRGKMEEQSFEIRQLQTQLERALSDMELRLGDLEGGGGRAPTTNVVQPVQGDKPVENFSWSSNQDNPVRTGQLGTLTQSGDTGAVRANDDSAAAAYENAFALLKNNQYDAAQRAFEQFIAQNPGHVLISNAKYWLGETHYVRGEYADAARIFAEGYKLYPKGSKAPDNLLKLGMALAGLGKTNDACVALGQLKKEYASGALPVIRRAEQEMTRLNCG